MNRPLRIGIDIDDILNDFFPHWIEKWNEKSGNHLLPSDVVEWDLTKFIPKKDWNEFMTVIEQQDFYDTLLPNPMAQVVVEELFNSNSEIFFITGTYANCVEMKENWVKKYFPFIPVKNILYVKPEFKHLVNVDIMIEDCPVELDKFSCTVLLLNKTYNIKSDFYSKSNIHRVNCWNDIRQVFVEKYDLLPEHSIAVDNLNQSYGVPIINDSLTENEIDFENENMSLSDKLLQCKTVDDFSRLLNPYFEKTFDAGYNSALGDMAKYMKELDKNIKK